MVPISICFIFPNLRIVLDYTNLLYRFGTTRSIDIADVDIADVLGRIGDFSRRSDEKPNVKNVG